MTRRAPFGFRFVLPLALGSMLNPINSSMIATALVPIGVAFHATAANLGWLIAGLYLASAVAQPALGRLADVTGPRRIYLASLALIALAGFLGPFAPTLAALVGVRILIGIGTSGAYPSAMRLFRTQADRYGEAAPRSAMSYLALGAMASAIVGPTLGGILTGAFGWQAILAVNVPLALGIAALVLLWVPKDAPGGAGIKRLLSDLDLPGMVLFTVFLLSLMFFLLNVEHPQWIALLISIVDGYALIRYSTRREQPFIDIRMLMNNRPLVLTYARVTAVMLVAYAFVYGFGQWLETGPHLSSTDAGLAMLPMAAAGAASTFLGRRTAGLRTPFLISIGCALIGCACMTVVTSSTPVWAIALTGIFFGPPQGMFATARRPPSSPKLRQRILGRQRACSALPATLEPSSR